MKTRSTQNISADDPTSAYAKAVVAGKIIVGPKVRGACQRHLNDLATGRDRGLTFDVAAAQRALNFFPDVLMIEGPTIDKDTGVEVVDVIPFQLLDCWTFVVGSIFGWKRDDGFRRFRSAYVEGGKGSGKTPLAAGIGLYMMLADGEASAEVYAAAAKRDQAMTLFKDVVKMVEWSPRLTQRLKKHGKSTVWQLTHIRSNSTFKPLSADRKKSGARVSCALVDELHEHKDRYTIDILKDGFKGRKQPLMFVITNSGFDRNSICWEWHEHACAVVDGLREDDELFAYVMSLDDGDDPLEDESCWVKTNPGIGITITEQYLRSQVNDARQIPGRENQVLRLNFCQWTDADIGWMTRNAWVGLEEDLIRYEGGRAIAPGFKDAICYGAIDLSFRFDLTALALGFPEGDELLAWIEYFTPLETIQAREKRDSVPYGQWVKQGLIHGVEGSTIRMEHVARRIGEVMNEFDVRWIAYDDYRHKELRDQMDELGVEAPWIDHPQGFRRGGQLKEIIGNDGKPIDNPLWMPDSVAKLEQRCLEKTIRVQPSLVTRWQVSSVAIRNDPAGTGNRVFDKRKAIGRIDGVVAAAMLCGVADMKLAVRSLRGFLANPVMTR